MPSRNPSCFSFAISTVQPFFLWLSTLIFCPWVSASAPIDLTYELIEQRPLPQNAFTQGLSIHNGQLYLSSGGWDNSFILHQPWPTSSQVPNNNEQSLNANDSFNPKKSGIKAIEDFFAEGLTYDENQLTLLSWQAGKALQIDPDTLNIKRTLNYQGQGWGLTHNPHFYIMSDGSDRLSFRHKKDFSLSHRLKVKGGQRRWQRLNELEYFSGLIWANIWQENIIIAINPSTGKVHGILNLSKIVANEKQRDPDSVLNGIAYDTDHQALWITGKRWRHVYRISITNLPKMQTP